MYHDWQNREARFRAVERGKTLLNRNRTAVDTLFTFCPPGPGDL
jgi:hypothetical protein